MRHQVQTDKESRRAQQNRQEAGEEHHDHLIDVRSGKVIEFQNEEIERLQRKVAEELGYRLVDHRLELYAIPLSDETDN